MGNTVSCYMAGGRQCLKVPRKGTLKSYSAFKLVTGTNTTTKACECKESLRQWRYSFDMCILCVYYSLAMQRAGISVLTASQCCGARQSNVYCYQQKKIGIRQPAYNE